MANQYVMYQGIPIDGDTPQPMFEAKWDVAPIKVVAQDEYDAVAAELAVEKEFRAAERQVLIENADRISQLEALLRRVVEQPNDPASWCADIVRLAPSATPLRRAHSKSEYKRLTALGVECAAPDTAAKGQPTFNYNGDLVGYEKETKDE